jgi:hypothetical protein
MIVLFGLLFLIITLIPVGLAYLVFRWLTKKGYKKIGLVILATVAIWTVYSSYTAFYPTDGFYEDEFEYNTGLDFPTSGDILTKDASYQDLHGDYSATAFFKTDSKDFKQILAAIQKDSKFQLDTIPFKFNLANFDTTIKETNFTKCYTLNRQDRNLIFTISFNDKDNLIEIQRDSW